MVAKSEIKFIKSLQQKKYRKKHSAFVAEGVKMVSDLLETSLRPRKIYSTDPDFKSGKITPVLIGEQDLKRMSNLVNPQTLLGVFEIPELQQPPDLSDWVVALDGVQDPGNLGTIIRLCDWFGVRDLICSRDTADCYNPKALQATMGSIGRVQVHYVSLPDYLENCHVPVYGASMQGTPVYTQDMPECGILVMGNEGKGLSAEIEGLLSQTISIPFYGKTSAESLNVATATGILLHEIRRPG